MHYSKYIIYINTSNYIGKIQILKYNKSSSYAILSEIRQLNGKIHENIKTKRKCVQLRIAVGAAVESSIYFYFCEPQAEKYLLVSFF